MWVQQGRVDQGMYPEQENRVAWPYTYLYAGLWRIQMYGSFPWENVCEREKKYVGLCNFITVKTQNNLKVWSNKYTTYVPEDAWRLLVKMMLYIRVLYVGLDDFSLPLLWQKAG